jgi:hypothetical protein
MHRKAAHRKAAYFENKIKTDSLLDRVIALKAGFQSYALGGDQSLDQEGDKSDEEGGVLCNRWREVATDIVAFIPESEADLEMKLKCIVLLNDMEDVSANDRIDAADGLHDEIAWSIIRDLVAARPNLSGIGLQPRCAEKL